MNCEKIMEDYHKKQEEEKEKFLQKCLNKIDNGNFAYELIVLAICKRFKLDIQWIPSVAYIMAEYYVENINEPFNEWVGKSNAPLIRPFTQIKKIFPELTLITKNDKEIIKIANEVYNLDLDYDFDADYVFSFSFDFNSFTPLNISEIKKLKQEINFCEKYNIDSSDLNEKLLSYGLTETQLELI